MKSKAFCILMLTVLLLTACGGSAQTDSPAKASFLPANGQVTVVTATPISVNAYAAARLLEQASWGPSPAAVAEVQRLGIEGWIDQQLLQRASLLNVPNYVIDYDNTNKAAVSLAWRWFNIRFYDLAIGGSDQLRQRMSWALYNFIVFGKIGFASYKAEYFNLMQRQSLGNFKDLIRDVSLFGPMGDFLNNNQNVATSPNENYARELMQLFTVGLVKLGPDGSILRDGQGKPLETYTQADVIMATKALSGWENVWDKSLPETNGSNAKIPMRAKTWVGAHDSTEKKLLGSVIPAGQTTEKDLESVISILSTHANAGPFIARRLIQAMVSSDPSPEYLARVAKVFKDSSGDLAKVAKAILMDPEARAGDDPKQQIARVGKIKEPILHQTNLLRGFGCTSAVMSKYDDNARVLGRYQEPYVAPNVFGYFPPNNKAPESLTPSPEQKLLSSNEFSDRANGIRWELEVSSNFTNAGCELNLFVQAANKSDEALIALISERFFKGAMPATLRLGAKSLLSKELATETAINKSAKLLQVLLSTPTFGVVK